MNLQLISVWIPRLNRLVLTTIESHGHHSNRIHHHFLCAKQTRLILAFFSPFFFIFYSAESLLCLLSYQSIVLCSQRLMAHCPNKSCHRLGNPPRNSCRLTKFNGESRVPDYPLPIRNFGFWMFFSRCWNRLLTAVIQLRQFGFSFLPFLHP